MSSMNKPPALSPAQAELVARLWWLIRLRWIFGASLLALGLFFTWRPFMQVRGPLIAILGAVILVYNAMFWFLEHRFGRHQPERQAESAPRAAAAQIVCDLVVLTAVLHCAGGIENPFFAYYVFHVVIATILLPTRWVFALAGLAIALFVILALGEMNAWLSHAAIFDSRRRHHQDPFFVATLLAAFASTLLIAVYLGTSIAARVRAREQEVIDLQNKLADHARDLERANTALQRADVEKNRFFRKVSHDLKAPLAAQQTLLRLVLYQFDDPSGPRQHVERAIARGDELLALLNDLLLLSRSQVVTDRNERGWTEPVEQLLPILENQAIHARSKGLHWRVETQQSLPSVHVHPGTLVTVMENLVSNAIKYTPAGGEVYVRLSGTNDSLVIEVRDTGIGIDQEDLPRVGQEFYRTRRARDSGAPGTGLGLAIVRSVVEADHGRLDIHGEPGKGTTVTVTLPLSPGRESSPPSTSDRS
ncbi:MAG: HAMP domain-containing histidine kinase [Phycisphaerales bacterium]|nr:HAMP domain-containing histidine kinase [Phycisphaerales bacterium]